MPPLQPPGAGTRLALRHRVGLSQRRSDSETGGGGKPELRGQPAGPATSDSYAGPACPVKGLWQLPPPSKSSSSLSLVQVKFSESTSILTRESDRGQPVDDDSHGGKPGSDAGDSDSENSRIGLLIRKKIL